MSYTEAHVSAAVDAFKKQPAMYVTLATPPGGVQAWYVRRAANIQTGADFALIAGPFASQKDAEAEYDRILIRIMLDAIHKDAPENPELERLRSMLRRVHATIAANKGRPEALDAVRAILFESLNATPENVPAEPNIPSNDIETELHKALEVFYNHHISYEDILKLLQIYNRMPAGPWGILLSERTTPPELLNDDCSALSEFTLAARKTIPPLVAALLNERRDARNTAADLQTRLQSALAAVIEKFDVLRDDEGLKLQTTTGTRQDNPIVNFFNAISHAKTILNEASPNAGSAPADA